MNHKSISRERVWNQYTARIDEIKREKHLPLKEHYLNQAKELYDEFRSLGGRRKEIAIAIEE